MEGHMTARFIGSAFALAFVVASNAGCGSDEVQIPQSPDDDGGALDASSDARAADSAPDAHPHDGGADADADAAHDAQPDACVPKACPGAPGVACGSIDDGCGHMVDCG